MCKKIISFFVVFAIVASSLLPTFAAETGSFYRPVGIEEWAETRDPDGGFQNVLEDYDSYVDTLPSSSINSTDSSIGLILTFSPDYLRISPTNMFSDPALYLSFGNDPKPGTMTIADLEDYHGCDLTCSSSVSAFDISFADNKDHTIYAQVYFDMDFPFSGFYTSLDTYFTVHLAFENGDVSDFERSTLNTFYSDSYYSKGSFRQNYYVLNYKASTISMSDFFSVKFLCIPDDSDSVLNQYNPSTRPSSITGDYGIIGDDGTIIKVDGDMIVDESSNTIYNPVTNTTISFTDYTYDYSDRSYNLTLEDGSTMKIIYGDENITINQGDTIYNIYYLIEDDSGGGSGDGGDESGDKHTHDYTSEVTKQPSCLVSGVRTFTCACGDSYTKTISATGHDWVISQQVPTTYDPETGEQTQAGYTVYVCGSCAEQYKSTDGSAPPNGGSGGDDSSGGFGDIIVGLFSVIGDIIGGLLEGALVLATKALEALTGLGDLFAQMIETILGFFGGFLDFLSAMFPFLPEETITILNFGLILMIAAAVFNKFFK